MRGRIKLKNSGKLCNTKNILALVPARGGSKGVPRKNIRPLLGKPLIAWTIEEAKKSRHISRIVVSTEDREIADVAVKYGAEIPFLRPEELAKDESPTIDCVIHALNWLKDNENYIPDLLLLLEATAPLKTFEDIDGAIEILLDKVNEIDAVIGLREVSEHPFWMNTLDAKGLIKDFIKTEREYMRRQELPPVYIVNGAIYLCKTEVLLRDRTFTPQKTFGFVMPPERSIDIDNEIDLELAELYLKGEQKNYG